MNYFLLCHGANTMGSIGSLEDFLMNKGHKVFKLLHPLDSLDNRHTIIRHNGTSITKRRLKFSPLSYFIDFFHSCKYLNNQRVDVFIGATNIDVLPAVFCRKILRKKITRIVYYPRDYSENKFNNKLANAVYYGIEAYVVRKADLTISNTHRAAEARKKLGLIESKNIVVPNGINETKMNFRPKKIPKNKFVYVGEVSNEHGLHDFIKIYARHIRQLTVIGSGSDWNYVKALCKDLKVDAVFYYKKPHNFVINFLISFEGIGLAPYNQNSKWTYYCSPLKVTEYIACNVPVIISNVPEVAQEIKNNKLGITYDTLEEKKLKKDIALMETNTFYKRAEEFFNTHTFDALFKNVLI